MEEGQRIKIAIKIPVPHWKNVNEWGDYHFALGLQKEFEKKGCDVIIQILTEWYNGDDIDCDVVLVLRGIQRYWPNNQHFNIMWNISHPDDIDIEEYNQYDYVLIASEIWAEKIKKLADVPVETMLQCCDPELFYPESSSDYNHELLFVGNSRKVFRKIIKDLLPTDKSLSVYGTNWHDLIDEKYIIGNHVPNKELRKAYSSCEILLNDHWDDMREKGFISNRLFDGFASGALIISDKVKGAEDVFGEALITYETRDELNDLIDFYLDNKELSKKLVESTRNNVITHHTFQNRAEYMLNIINSNLYGEIIMNRLWNVLVRPILEEINAQYIIETGIDLGLNTKNILEYCIDNDAHLTAIDPLPKLDIKKFKAEYGNKFEIYTELSSDRLQLLKDYDAIFINGYHNHDTVYNELKTIEKSFKTRNFLLYSYADPK